MKATSEGQRPVRSTRSSTSAPACPVPHKPPRLKRVRAAQQGMQDGVAAEQSAVLQAPPAGHTVSVKRARRNLPPAAAPAPAEACLTQAPAQRASPVKRKRPARKPTPAATSEAGAALLSISPFEAHAHAHAHASAAGCEDDAAAAASDDVTLQCLTTVQQLQAAVAYLAARDPGLPPLIAQHGLPHPLLAKADGAATCFSALARSVVYQQLSGSVAAAILARVLVVCKVPPAAAVGGCVALDPDQLLAAPLDALRGAGLSARKAEYLQGLARFFKERQAGDATDQQLTALDHEALVGCLTAVKGVGRWTVDMLAMFHMGRPDVLPVGDLGVRRGLQVLHGLRELPGPAEMECLTQHWRPYRSVACWYMWRIPPPPRTSPAKAKRASR